MKKITITLIMLAVALLTTGCIADKDYLTDKADKVYKVTEKVYVGAKAAVEANVDSFSDETLEKLKKVDTAASAYDSTRTLVKQMINGKPNDDELIEELHNLEIDDVSEAIDIEQNE